MVFAGILQSWSDWGEWSGSLRPCSEKVYRSRRRSCPNVTNPDGYPVTSCCNSSSEDVEYSCNGSELMACTVVSSIFQLITFAIICGQCMFCIRSSPFIHSILTSTLLAFLPHTYNPHVLMLSPGTHNILL